MELPTGDTKQLTTGHSLTQQKNMRRWIVIALLGGIGAICVLLFFYRDTILSNQQQDKTPINDIHLTPTPHPFARLTIPYLRNQKYSSTFGERTVLYSYDSYTAYLTSYESEGNTINGLLTVPKGERPAGGWPAVVFVHGYIPPAQYQTDENYVAYVDYLARQGLVIFKIDLRGHGESEGDPSGAYYSSDYVIDTLNAYAALQGAKEVNPDKIGLWGHSMAGNVVMRAAAAKPKIPAIVIWAGAVYTYLDMREYGIQDSSYVRPSPDSQRMRERERLNQIAGDVTADNPFWQQVAPSSFLSELKGTIHIHHAVDDEVVSIEYSRNIDSLLDKTAVPHEFYEYPSGGHNIQGVSFTQAMERTAELFNSM